MESITNPSNDVWKFLGVDARMWLPELLTIDGFPDYSHAVPVTTRKWLEKFIAPHLADLYSLSPSLRFK